LTFILEGEGILFVGDKLDRFKHGDLYLIGPNLPHVFRNEVTHLNSGLPARARAISIFFLKESIMGMFQNIPEAQLIEKLFKNAEFGVRLSRGNSKEILPHLKKLLKLEGIQRILEFLMACSRMSANKNVEIISTKTPMIHDAENSERLNKVFDYILNNYSKDIALEKVASLICMTPTSFCRYFKRRTQKTFSQYLIEVRISHACKHLVKKGLSVSEACYSSGYNNISNFHRHFITITGMTPNHYKQHILNP
jgi:YesN/AraC family two-component response regulator